MIHIINSQQTHSLIFWFVFVLCLNHRGTHTCTIASKIYIYNCPKNDVQCIHYSDVIMGAIVSQITSLTTVYSTVYSDPDQRNYQSSAPLAFVRGSHRWPVKFPHKWPVTRKMFPFDDVIILILYALKFVVICFLVVISWASFCCWLPHFIVPLNKYYRYLMSSYWCICNYTPLRDVSILV